MNLEESNDFVERQRKNDSRKKVIIGSIIFCAFIVVLLVFLIIFIRYRDSLKLKMYVDGREVNIKSTLFQEVDGITYINIRELATMVGYEYKRGEYLKYSEDIESCYLVNNFETVAITADTDSFVKYITPAVVEDKNNKAVLGNIEVSVKSDDDMAEIYKIENPIKLIDNILYMDFNTIVDMFNLQVNTSSANRIYIYTLPTIVNNVIKQLPSLGYKDIDGTYENLRALIYGIAIVGKDNYYGIVNISTREEIAGTKYSEIVFVQNVKEFLITAENTVGLLSREGNTIIRPTEYDEISVLDQVNGLYQVKKGRYYGVLNRAGEVVVYVENNQVGYKDVKKFTDDNIENPKLLFNSIIPVEKDGKFGLYDSEGTELLKTVYDGFGYSTKTTDSLNEESRMIIPESVGIKGIIIVQKDLYGIFDAESKSIIIPCVSTKIYSVTKSGKTTYYMEYNDEQIDISEHLEKNNLKTVKSTNISNVADVDDELDF